MATIKIKISQATLDQLDVLYVNWMYPVSDFISLMNRSSSGPAAGFGETAVVAWKETGSTLDLTYADGATGHYDDVTLADPAAASGTATAHSLTVDIPGGWSMHATGNLASHRSGGMRRRLRIFVAHPSEMLTDHVPPSAAKALEVVPSTSAAIRTRRIPSLPSMMSLSLRGA